MDDPGHDASRAGSHRNSLNPHQFPQGISYTPPNFDPPFDPRFEDIKQEQDLTPQHDNPHPTHQFGDYPLYSAPDDFAYGNNIATSGASINPAALSLMDSSSGNPPGHHRAPSLQLDPNQHDSPGHQPAYLSATSTQPSTSGYEWESIFAHSESWGHRRAPSEYSEISSATQSPYIVNEEFGGAPSPLLGAQFQGQDSMQELLNSGGGGEAFGLEAFTISDEGDPSPCLSPSGGFHSRANSPYLVPQDSQNPGLTPLMSGVRGIDMQSMGPPPAGHGASQPQGLGIEDSFPRIDISFAPPQRQPTFPGKPGMLPDHEALSPPPKCMCRDNVARISTDDSSPTTAEE
jgi:hypothetical protein